MSEKKHQNDQYKLNVNEERLRFYLLSIDIFS